MEFPEEFSCYNESITSLSELEPLSKTLFTKIRVLHCSNLTSMHGIEGQSKLIELNLSSNSIQRMEGLLNMSCLKVLNLSCNNIRVINCLNGLYNIEKLNLSYNKISSLSSLRQIYGDQYQSFTHFDIRGNNISQLNELKNLSGCRYLIDVAFQGQSGTNSVCKEPEYVYWVLQALPGLKFLDHQPVSSLVKNYVPEKIITEKKFEAEIKQSVEIEPHKIFKELQDEELKGSYQMNKARTENKEKDELKETNKKLQNDLDELYSAYKELSFKYKNAEEYWSSNVKRLEDTIFQASYEKKDVEAENRRLRKKLNTKVAKINNLKAKAAQSGNTGSKALEDFHLQISNLMKDLGESQRMSQQAVDDVYKKQEKIKNLEKNNYELKSEIKRLETSLNQLHAKALENSSNALHKYEELQKKYEENLNVTQEKEAEITLLKAKNLEILDLNSKFDENWSNKYREAVHSRENTISSLREELHRLSLSEKEKAQQMIYSEKEDFQKKIWELDQKLIFQSSEFKEKLRDNELKFIDLIRESNDLKEMLKMSVERESKSKDFIIELTEIVKQLEVKLDKEISEKNSQKKETEEKISNLELENVALKNKNFGLKSRLEILEKDVNLGEDSVHMKNREIAKLKREILDLKVVVEDLEEKSKNFKAKLEKTENNLNKEIEELIEQNKELEISLSTKNSIINDQNDSIKDLKQIIAQYEEEIEQFQNNKNSYKENYENKLQDAYDEIETLRNKLTNTENAINEIESQIIELDKKKNEYKERNSELEKQIQEKNEILEFVEAEVNNIKKEKDAEVHEISLEKDGVIADLKKFRDDLTRKVMGLDKDVKEKNAKLTDMEQENALLKQGLAEQLRKEKEMQEEIRALLMEMDNQKRQASEKISQLSKLFA